MKWVFAIEQGNRPIGSGIIGGRLRRREDHPRAGARRVLYSLFDQIVRSSRTIRQQGKDNEPIRFRALLQDFREGQITPENCDILAQRVAQNLSSNIRNEFDNALRMYVTHLVVDECKFKTLYRNKLPVILVEAKHSPSNAEQCLEENAQGLPLQLVLSKGCRLMVTSNLLTKFRNRMSPNLHCLPSWYH